ncbi:hypothetical protein C2G38_2142472 [Gigaspora rosea]|uniref:Transmembrane protein n=1 Tax=Gigaspora rosea TaxID=44941 RepID=A0A397V5K4_9GLOM|nr:hypothetical protein C2G38_2142472 [Gigaspora rosea]
MHFTCQKTMQPKILTGLVIKVATKTSVLESLPVEFVAFGVVALMSTLLWCFGVVDFGVVDFGFVAALVFRRRFWCFNCGSFVVGFAWFSTSFCGVRISADFVVRYIFWILLVGLRRRVVVTFVAQGVC